MLTIVTLHIYLTELDGMTLLLRILHALDIELGEIKLELTDIKAFSLVASFHNSGWCYVASGGKRSTIMLSRCEC